MGVKILGSLQDVKKIILTGLTGFFREQRSEVRGQEKPTTVSVDASKAISRKARKDRKGGQVFYVGI